MSSPSSTSPIKSSVNSALLVNVLCQGIPWGSWVKGWVPPSEWCVDWRHQQVQDGEMTPTQNSPGPTSGMECRGRVSLLGERWRRERRSWVSWVGVGCWRDAASSWALQNEYISTGWAVGRRASPLCSMKHARSWESAGYRAPTPVCPTVPAPLSFWLRLEFSLAPGPRLTTLSRTCL